jgi:hypothetical protein
LSCIRFTHFTAKQLKSLDRLSTVFFGIFLIRQDHGGAFYLPAWMITPEAGLIKPFDTPRLPLEGIVAERRLEA